MGKKNAAHLDIGIALHNFLDAREREGWMFEIRRFLLRGVDLALPERAQKVVERVAGLDKG